MKTDNAAPTRSAPLDQVGYRVIGAQLEPRAQWHQNADGSWLLHAPPGEWAVRGPQGSLAWRALSGRAGDDTPMMCQRAGDGNWRCLSWALGWSQSRSLAGALLRLGYGSGRPIATLSGPARPASRWRFQ